MTASYPLVLLFLLFALHSVYSTPISFSQDKPNVISKKYDSSVLCPNTSPILCSGPWQKSQKEIGQTRVRKDSTVLSYQSLKVETRCHSRIMADLSSCETLCDSVINNFLGMEDTCSGFQLIDEWDISTCLTCVHAWHVNIPRISELEQIYNKCSKYFSPTMPLCDDTCMKTVKAKSLTECEEKCSKAVHGITFYDGTIKKGQMEDNTSSVCNLIKQRPLLISDCFQCNDKWPNKNFNTLNNLITKCFSNEHPTLQIPKFPYCSVRDEPYDPIESTELAESTHDSNSELLPTIISRSLPSNDDNCHSFQFYSPERCLQTCQEVVGIFEMKLNRTTCYSPTRTDSYQVDVCLSCHKK